jgi:hypothetical protein
MYYEPIETADSVRIHKATKIQNSHMYNNNNNNNIYSTAIGLEPGGRGL